MQTQKQTKRQNKNNILLPKKPLTPSPANLSRVCAAAATSLDNTLTTTPFHGNEVTQPAPCAKVHAANNTRVANKAANTVPNHSRFTCVRPCHYLP